MLDACEAPVSSSYTRGSGLPETKEALKRFRELCVIEERCAASYQKSDEECDRHNALLYLPDCKRWMNKTLTATSIKSDLAKAILYTSRRWHALIRYAEDCRIKIDSNAIER
jgi:hypothetical protein